jgi:hypothetical protein
VNRLLRLRFRQQLETGLDPVKVPDLLAEPADHAATGLMPAHAENHDDEGKESDA